MRPTIAFFGWLGLGCQADVHRERWDSPFRESGTLELCGCGGGLPAFATTECRASRDAVVPLSSLLLASSPAGASSPALSTGAPAARGPGGCVCAVFAPAPPAQAGSGSGDGGVPPDMCALPPESALAAVRCVSEPAFERGSGAAVGSPPVPPPLLLRLPLGVWVRLSAGGSGGGGGHSDSGSTEWGAGVALVAEWGVSEAAFWATVAPPPQQPQSGSCATRVALAAYAADSSGGLVQLAAVGATHQQPLSA
jgi:hypothetical protein